MTLSPVATIWERALDLVFPRRCVSCGAFGSFICSTCLAATGRAEPPRCPVCWMPGAGGTCVRCRREPPAFEAARSTFVYRGVARDAVLALKFRGLSATAEEMARPMADHLAEWSPAVSFIAPVPLTGRRRRERGYNQSEVLAREISRMWGVPLACRVVVRRRATAPQVSLADEDARRSNLVDAFGPGPEAVKGGVLLVDDVLTTGATLDACAKAVRQAGGGPVYALTFARED
jgi:ComF family protein